MTGTQLQQNPTYYSTQVRNKWLKLDVNTDYPQSLPDSRPASMCFFLT